MAAFIPLASAATIPFPHEFKFDPTDEEIVVHYLRRRAVNQPLPSDSVTDKEILEYNPWDLLPEGASEKYYFHHRVRWASGTRYKRGARDGFWKPSGKQVPILSSALSGRDRTKVGCQRTMVFYLGRAPAGERTEWVMQQFCHGDEGLAPFFVMKPGTNLNLGQSSSTEDVSSMRQDDLGDPRRGSAESNQTAGIILEPDKSWVVCRVYKKRKNAPRVSNRSNCSIGGDKLRFIDFLGVGNNEGSSS